MFLYIVIILAVISVLLSLFSLRELTEKPGVTEVKKSLNKSKIIYMGKNHSSSSDS